MLMFVWHSVTFFTYHVSLIKFVYSSTVAGFTIEISVPINTHYTHACTALNRIWFRIVQQYNTVLKQRIPIWLYSSVTVINPDDMIMHACTCISNTI